MELIIKEHTSTRFGDLKPGDGFRWNDQGIPTPYLKLEDSPYDEFNALDLKSLDLTNFDDATLVEKAISVNITIQY